VAGKSSADQALQESAHAAKLRARKEGELAEVWLWGKLLYAVLVEKLAMKRCGNEWRQMKPGRRGDVVANLAVAE